MLLYIFPEHLLNVIFTRTIGTDQAYRTRILEGIGPIEVCVSFLTQQLQTMQAVGISLWVESSVLNEVERKLNSAVLQPPRTGVWHPWGRCFVLSHFHWHISFSSCSVLFFILAALNLLGLTWQLKPVEAPVLSHGLGTAGMPGTNDDTTGPSGGRGKQRSL